MKLRIIRALGLLCMRLGSLVLGRRPYGWACRWFHRYLKGTGGVAEIPRELIEEIKDDIFSTFAGDTEPCDGGFRRLWHHSLQYSGSGFFSRPALFYMIGGFTATVTWVSDSRALVEISDVYDWNPKIGVDDDGRETTEWFTTGLPLKPWLHRWLNRFLGDRYYPLAGFPMGQPGFSNELWRDLGRVGAKPFESRFSGYFEWDGIGDVCLVYGYSPEPVIDHEMLDAFGIRYEE